MRGLYLREDKEPKPKLFLVRICSGGMGVFHVKGWGPKSSLCPSKPMETKLFGGILGVLLGNPGWPEKFQNKEFVFNFRPLVFALAQIQENICEESFSAYLRNSWGKSISVRIHAVPVFAPARIQENIPGESSMYWFHARGVTQTGQFPTSFLCVIDPAFKIVKEFLHCSLSRPGHWDDDNSKIHEEWPKKSLMAIDRD